MRPQAFIALLGTAAAVLLKIARVGAATAFTFVLVPPAFPQDPQDATSACDRAAASPTDKKRPFGVPGVFFASIDPKVAIPACQQASAAAPENPRILYQMSRAHAAAKANESARAYVQKASDLGYPPAQASLATFYAFGGGGLARNDEKALRLSRLAADQGDGLGHNNIGFFYEFGRGGLPKDDNAAAQHYKSAAEAGEAWGQYNLGRFYQNGRGGLTADDREAARLYKLAADQRHAPAEVNLGFFYETGRGGLAKDDGEAVRLYQRAAEQGNAFGQNNLGRFYLGGRGGLPQSDEEAARLYRLAADQGHAAAQANLGFLYETGRGGLAKDDVEAVRLYQRAAEQGNALGRYDLGRFYQAGRGGLAPDDREAARLYKLAADQGNERAQVNLGFFYEIGRGGLPLNEAEAAKLYRLAAQRGHPNAQNRLAMFYELGRGGLPKDIGEAIRLYKLAAAQDRDQDAKLWASDVLARLTASTAAPSSSISSLPLVAFLSLGNGAPTSPAFHRGLAEAGFIEGKNVRFELRASPSNDQLATLAAELINSRPSVIVATNSPIAVLAARAATSTVPIVFASSVDPVAYGFVKSLSRPGGNLTGVSLLSSELISKRLGLLLEAAPDATIAYLTMGPGSPIYKDLRDRTVAAGRALGREIIVLEANSTRDLQPAFATLAEKGAGALMLGSFTNFIPMREKIVALAQQYKVPAMYPSAIYTRAGGLMSYTADSAETDRLLGYQYVGRLLKGMKASDLPVQQPTKFELSINLKTAKALGLTIPETLLATADEVIQ
jgi:TPR repeat protein/ABC-type uncharacterized transport system substrate-binding protein